MKPFSMPNDVIEQRKLISEFQAVEMPDKITATSTCILHFGEVKCKTIKRPSLSLYAGHWSHWDRFVATVRSPFFVLNQFGVSSSSSLPLAYHYLVICLSGSRHFSVLIAGSCVLNCRCMLFYCSVDNLHFFSFLFCFFFAFLRPVHECVIQYILPSFISFFIFIDLHIHAKPYAT